MFFLLSDAVSNTFFELCFSAALVCCEFLMLCELLVFHVYELFIFSLSFFFWSACGFGVLQK